MKRIVRGLVAVLFVPVAGALLLGCPKKPGADAGAQPAKVTESVVATHPAGGGPGGAGGPGAGGPGGTAGEGAARTGKTPAQEAEEQRMAQLLASRGDDIPIKEAPAMEFVPPAAEDKLTLKPIYFDYDKSNIKPEYQTVLEGIARWMQSRPAVQLLIEGHCDERGTDEYNLALGERRALSVRRYLVALGIAADRLHTISYGEESPADPGHDESAWVKNRRTEFKVSAP